MPNRSESQCRSFIIVVATVFALLTGHLASLQSLLCSKQTCGECIQTLGCAWCQQEDFFNQSRCFPIASLLHQNCTPDQLINPRSNHTVLQADGLTRIAQQKLGDQQHIDGDENKTAKIVQITPQQISLKLRPNEPYQLNFQYAQAKDHPVDLYYLMDLSHSMKEHKDKLSKIGSKLAHEMRKITKNFRLGFGSFVDKVVMPFTLTNAKFMENPCHGQKDTPTCSPPYSYIHHMTLSDNATKFEEEVKRAQLSANLDSPEGGFDAIMQAIVCRKEIGWRDEAQRLVIFSTDAGFHYAGDGKLGGIIEPNDGQCHMANNRYTHDKILDYPSVSHLNKIVKDHSVRIIFVVNSAISKIYRDLTTSIEGSSFGILDQSSENVVELIKGEYSKISAGVEIRDNAVDPINIKYLTSCLQSDRNATEQNKCMGLAHDSIVNFTAEIVATECPADVEDWKQQVKIYPVAVNEAITIDIEIICSCECEKDGSALLEKKSKKCSSNGTYKCGMCECDDQHYGLKCDCSGAGDFSRSNSSSSNCRRNPTDRDDCSSRGSCFCGVCKCETRKNTNELISGQYCECDNYTCDRHKNLLCNGEDHGTCECGVCVCKPGWSGKSCNCKESKDSCKMATDDEICSGRGQCKCGECKCNEDSKHIYGGEFCQTCSTCENCGVYKDCVECLVHGSGALRGDECSSNCTEFVPEIVDQIDINKSEDENDGWIKCKSSDANSCEFIFEYKVEAAQTVTVRAEKEKTCPPVVSPAAIVSMTLFPLLGFGLFLLFSWKIITTIHDRREYSKFEKEKLMAKWDAGDNPIYKEANQLFRNPNYNN